MPNHYHLLIYLRDEGLSAAMHRFTMSYTNAINRRYDRSGSLFQGRFQLIHVDRDEYLLNLTCYIHLNPVKDGFVQRPEEWEFSSYHEYVNLRPGTLPQPQYVLPQVGDAAAYRQFVAACDLQPLSLIFRALTRDQVP